MAAENLLDVRGLSIGPLHAPPLVKDLSFSLEKGQSLGMLGASGSGKSLTLMALMRLLPHPGLCRQKGDILFAGRDLALLSELEMQALRGRSMAAVFQDPLASLNPVRSLGSQLREVFTFHEQGMSPQEISLRLRETLQAVGLQDHEALLQQYPHQISGGMRQRVAIAMAILLDPELVLADEPSSSLDVALQAQVLKLLQKLQSERGLSLLFVSHDLAVIADLCRQCLVLYEGRIVEKAPTIQLIEQPLHPYTQALIAALPLHGRPPRRTLKAKIETEAGQVRGCSFQYQCRYADAVCRTEEPILRQLQSEHWIACHRAEEIG